MLKIIHCSHWQEAPKGWTVLSEQDQDITQRLNNEDNSVDVYYNEHGLEHISLTNALFFIKECFRCLKNGGVLRIVTPCIDKLIQFENNAVGKHFSSVQLLHYFVAEDAALKELGINGIADDPLPFLMDSLLKGHNHRHVWSSKLLKKVLEKIGFSEVYVCNPGETHFDKSDCLERIIRGVEPNYVLKEFGLTHYDPESLVVEAKK